MRGSIARGYLEAGIRDPLFGMVAFLHKYFLFIFGLLSIFLAPYNVASAAEAAPLAMLYVSPTGAGTECTAYNPCLIEAAKAKARVWNAQSPRDITVRLASGRYELANPIVFDSADSGAEGRTVKYVAEKSGTVFLTGAVPVIDWTLYNAKLNIWSAMLPPSVAAHEVSGMAPRSFFFNGRREERARMMLTPLMAGTPNLGNAKLADDAGYLLTIPGMEKWSNPRDIEIAYTNWWTMVRCPVDQISAGKILVQHDCWAAMQKNFTRRNGVGLNWLENNLAFLSKPSQWYIDRVGNKIYYIPLPNEKVNAGDANVGVSEQLIVLDGVSNLSFDGLTFTETNWYGYRDAHSDYPYVGYTPHQSGDNALLHQQPVAAIDIRASHHVSITNSIFIHLGGSGLSIGNGSSDIVVADNQFRSTSASGLQIGSPNETRETKAEKQNANITIDNNFFSNNGMEYWDNPAIMAYAMQGSKISHNEIEKCPWSCIAFGWGWGYYAAYNNTVVIANNYIHDGMTHLLDGAGIYTNGKTMGNITIENNVIEHIGTVDQPNCDFRSWQKHFQGIYHDEGSDEYVDRNNLVTAIIPRALATSAKDECRGNWLKLNAKIHITVNGNMTDYDHVVIAPSNDLRPDCHSGDSSTTCIPGASDNLISPNVEKSERAKLIRSKAGLIHR
jgi:hypothetical protein